MALDRDKVGILDRLNPDGQKALLGQEILRLGEEEERLLRRIDELEIVISEQKFFAKTGSIKASEAGTRVHILAESQVAQGKKAYPIGFYLILKGEEPWTGGEGTKLFIADSGTELIYRFATIDKGALAPGNYLTPSSEEVVLEAEFGMTLGGREGKGIDILADKDFETGSELCVTVYGYIE